MRTKISVVIPAYNEENRIGETLDEYIRFFKKKGCFEILVVTDGTDRTVDIVKDFSRKHHEIKSLNFKTRLGKGGAIIKGFSEASGELVAIADADCATSPEELHKLAMNIGDYDGIIGSRWMKGSRVLVKQPLLRRVASRGFNILVHLLLGLNYKDTQCGAKVFKKVAVSDIESRIKTKGFAFDISLLHLMNRDGKRIKEFPITWSDRKMSTLKISKAVPKMFVAILKLFFDL